MEQVILMTKVKNAVKREFGENVKFSLHNIIVNGQKRGCSGFIVNPENNVTIYIDTEKSVFLSGLLVRYARDCKDYTGCHNTFTKNRSLDALTETISTMLRDEEKYKSEVNEWHKRR